MLSDVSTTNLVPVNWVILITLCHTIQTCMGYLNGSGPFSDEYRLIHALLDDYDATVRPRYDSSEAVNVSVRFSLQQIYDLDEKRQILTISGWLTAEWHDDFLQWKPDHYGGVSAFVINPKRIWTPLLAIGNSANKMFQDWKHFWVTIRNDGSCRWQPGGNFALTCRLDMNYYPFDKQDCTMEIETWFYSADKVELLNSMAHFGLETYLQHGEWALDGTNVSRTRKRYQHVDDEDFPQLNFTIHLRRKYTFHFLYILLPCIMLSFVLLMVFLLPAESGEKVSLGVSILVAFSVFLLIVAEQVPDTSDAVPVLAIYLMYFMMATALSVMSSTLVIKIHYKGHESPPPRWLSIVTFDLVAPLLCLSTLCQWEKSHRSCQHLSGENCCTISRARKYQILEETCGMNGIVGRQSTNHIKGSARASANHITRNTGRNHVFSKEIDAETFETERNICSLTRSKYIEQKWKKISEVMDRMFFWLFLLFLIIPLVSLFGFIRIFKTKFDP